MEPLRNLPGIVGTPAVHERQGGNKRQADAFRRALQQDPGGARQDAPADERAVRRLLQPQRPDVRKDGQTAHHVDVLA